MPRPTPITRYRPHPLPVIYGLAVMAFAAWDWCREPFCSVNNTILFFGGMFLLIFLPNVTVSDEELVVSWVFGLYKRRTSLSSIVEIKNATGRGRGAVILCLCIANGKPCNIFLVTQTRLARFVQDIRSRLKHPSVPSGAPAP